MNEEIFTTQDSEKAINDIGVALDSLYKSSTPDQNLHPAVSNILHRSSGSVPDDLKKLEEDLRSRKTVIMTVSNVPNRDLIAKIYGWFWRTLGIKVLLSFEIDPMVRAGCKLSYDGKYFDYSLDSMVDDFFDNKVQHGENI